PGFLLMRVRGHSLFAALTDHDLLPSAIRTGQHINGFALGCFRLRRSIYGCFLILIFAFFAFARQRENGSSDRSKQDHRAERKRDEFRCSVFHFDVTSTVLFWDFRIFRISSVVTQTSPSQRRSNAGRIKITESILTTAPLAINIHIALMMSILE